MTDSDGGVDWSAGVGGGVAHAAGFDLDVFKPVASATGTFCEENGLTLGRGALDVEMAGGYAHRPLVLTDQKNPALSRDIVRDRVTTYLTVMFGITDGLDAGVRLAAVARQVGDVNVYITGDAGLPQRPSTAAIGDVDLLVRWALVRVDRPRSQFRLTLSVPLGIPTGHTDALAGSGQISVRPRLIAGWHTAALALSVSAGYAYAPAVEVPWSAVVVGQAVTAGVGLSLAVVPRRFWLQGEVSAAAGLDVSTTAAGPAIVQVMMGPRLQLPGAFVLQAGVGTGLTQSAGSPRVRAVVGLGRSWPSL